MSRTSTTRARAACITVSAAALILGLAACGGSSTAESSAASPAESAAASAPAASAPAASAAAGVDAAAVALIPAGIADDGTLTVGMEVAYPPFGYMDTDNVTPIGFDVDLATEMANRLGLKLVIVDAGFDSIIPSLASNRYEAGVSAFSITPERQKEVDFVTYFESGDSALVLTGNPKGLSLDTRLCGVKTAVLKGSTQEVVTIPAIDADCKAAGMAPIEVLSLGNRILGWHPHARTLTVEGETVIPALNRIVDDTSGREGKRTMRTAILEGHRTTVAFAIEHYRDLADHPADRLANHFGCPGRDVPRVEDVHVASGIHWIHWIQSET